MILDLFLPPNLGSVDFGTRVSFPTPLLQLHKTGEQYNQMQCVDYLNVIVIERYVYGLQYL